ncbi:2765_t:CDS:1, partial [Rhizophagus irregularis]
FVYTKEGNVLSDEILIYKIGNYADFDQVENLSQSPSGPPATEPPAMKPSPQDTKHIKLVTIIAIISSILGFIIIIIAAFIIYKRYKKHAKSILFIE